MPLVECRDERGKKQKIFTGAFSYFFDQTFEKIPRSFVEVHPPFPSSQSKTKFKSAIGAISAAQSIELWKEPDSETVRVIASSTPEAVEILVKDLETSYPGTRVAPIADTEPRFVSHSSELVKEGYTAYFFDVEQAHALPGCAFDQGQPLELIEGLTRVLRGRAGWVQIVWADYDWTHAIEAASIMFQRTVTEIRRGVKTTTMNFGGIGQNFVPKFEQSTRTDPHPAAGSTIDAHGDQIAREYFERSQRHAAIVSVRGMILSHDPPEQLASALAGVKMSFDYLTPWFYADARMLRWLRSRALPDPSKMLAMHAQGGFLREWGKGRELIPILCVTTEEMPILIHLPQDPTLSGVVTYSRSGGLPTPAGHVQTQPGFVIGEVL